MPKPPKKSTASGSDARKAQAATTFPKLPDGIHDLAELKTSLGHADEALRRVFFRNYDEAAFYERGVTAASEDILADTPRFVSSSLRILSGLDARRQGFVLLPPAVFGVLVDEATKLEGMLQSHGDVSTAEAGDIAARELNLKKQMTQGVALRDRVLAALRSAVGAARIATTRAAASDASAPAALAKGLRAVAAFVNGVYEGTDEDDQASLGAFGVTEERAAELEALAAAIEKLAPVTAATGKRVSRRALDIQDGRVLLLVEAVLRAFRQARRSDKSILLPELNRLSNLFETRSSSTKGDAEEAPAEPSGEPKKPG